MGRVLFVTDDSLDFPSVRKVLELYQDLLKDVGISVGLISLRQLKSSTINIFVYAKNYKLIVIAYESVRGDPSEQIKNFLKREYSSKETLPNVILHPILMSEVKDIFDINLFWNPYQVRKRMQYIVPESLLHIRAIEQVELSSINQLYRDINEFVASLLK